MMRATTRRVAVIVTLTALATLGGCRHADRQATTQAPDRVPFPIDSIPITSDARLDSSDRLLGSFVGEGTSRAIHLLSNDTALIATLYRRYGPPLTRGESVWSRLNRVGTAALLAGDGRTGPIIQEPLAGFAGGHSSVEPLSIVLRGNRCGALGSLAEIIVGESHGAGWSVFHGPVLGSFQTRPRTDLADGEVVERVAAPLPDPALRDSLLARSERAVDSAIGQRLPGELLPLRVLDHTPLEINSLEDIDAADVVAMWSADDLVSYAVALRVRRVTSQTDTLLVSAVLMWDSAGQNAHTVLRPTILGLRGGQPTAFSGEWRTMYWRRLEAISGFGSGRDYLWLEQVHPSEPSVVWGVVSPVTNTVVAAARVVGPCDR